MACVSEVMSLMYCVPWPEEWQQHTDQVDFTCYGQICKTRTVNSQRLAQTWNCHTMQSSWEAHTLVSGMIISEIHIKETNIPLRSKFLMLAVKRNLILAYVFCFWTPENQEIYL